MAYYLTTASLFRSSARRFVVDELMIVRTIVVPCYHVAVMTPELSCCCYVDHYSPLTIITTWHHNDDENNSLRSMSILLPPPLLRVLPPRCSLYSRPLLDD